MKIKVVLASVAVVAIAVVAFAFTSKKPTSMVTKYINEDDISTSMISSLVPAELNVAANWDGSPVTIDGSGSLLAAIDFNLDDVNPANGGADGDLTLQEAVDAVRNQYNTSTHNFNSYSFTEGTATINIYKKVNP
jgi:hypothetical protein